ncbi:MAG: Uma2 family endonuclease [Candidatus Heimdallarchaeota archaeon]|nr:Uma2 family endonuclease [Candidatus Heimdallarchaeota archaeon]
MRTTEDGKILWSYSQLKHSFPEFLESPIIEIIKGNLYMSPSRSIKHQRILRRLIKLLEAFFEEKPVAELFIAPVDVILSENDVVIPDLFIILDRHKDSIKITNVEGVPDFVIEILSKNVKQDTEIKKALYAKYGVEEYWVVDQFDELIIRFNSPVEGKYIDKQIYKTTDLITSVVFKDFIFRIEDLFGNL